MTVKELIIKLQEKNEDAPIYVSALELIVLDSKDNDRVETIIDVGGKPFFSS